jgi:hypothetical protein
LSCRRGCPHAAVDRGRKPLASPARRS